MLSPLFSEFFQANIIWFGALFAVFAMLIIDIKKNSFGGFNKISATQVPLLQRDPTFLLDVSPKKDFNTGHIADSINIPATSFSADNTLFKASTTDNIVIVDQSGFTVGPVAKKLRIAGYENVFVLDGGITNWHKENFPLTVK